MKRKHAGRRGQTAVMFTLAAIPLFGIMGLAVDLGWSQFRKQAAQTAADAAGTAAALAAYQAAAGSPMSCTITGIACYANETPCSATLPSTPTNNVEAGCLYARDNGFMTTGRQTVTFQSGVGTAPTSPGATMSYWVVVRVKESVPQLFSAALGFPTAMVVARATVGAKDATAGGCVITLNPTASESIRNNGTTNLTSGCGVFVNSSAADAINIVGGGNILTTGGAKTEVVGNWTGSGTISPAPTIGVPYMGDPMGDMEPPTIGACTNGGVSLGSHQSQTINPGVYCGGISLGAQSSLTLNPGLYIVRNFLSLGAQTSISGTGVTIYMETGGVSMAGGSTVSLSAPSSGYYQGVLFFQARGNTTASTLVGGTSQQMNGALYFPSAQLTYSGGSSLNATQTTIIADTLRLDGNSNIAASASTRFDATQGGLSLIQ